MKKNVVVIGGGHGQSIILEGLKNIDDINLSAIVTVADNGGSTGRLKNSYNVPAMGDIRNVMVALAAEESIMADLMDYRFEGKEDVGGHALGNLIITALTQINGNFVKSIIDLSTLLNLKGEVVPSTTQLVDIYALMKDGTKVFGESNIPKQNNQIDQIFYMDDVKANNYAVEVIKRADYIIFGIGSLYTSIMPNIIIDEIKDALKVSNAEKIYFANVMSQLGETDGYSLEDHVKAIEKHSYKGIIDKVIFPNNIISDEILLKYNKSNTYKVPIKEIEHDYKIMYRDLLDFNTGYIRHSSKKIEKVFREILKEG